MKKLMIIAVAALVAAPALAALNSAWTRKQTEDPRVLRETLSTNFGEAETRLADVEKGEVTLAGLSVVGRGASTSGDTAAITAGTDHFVLRRSGTALAFGLLGTANLAADAAIAATQLSSGAQTSLTRADLITRETTTAGAILSLPEGTDNGTQKVTFAAPAALTGDRTITVPDADVTLANIAASVGAVNDLIDYLSDGLLVAGDLAISATPAEYQTTATAIWTVGGVAKAKVAADNLTFSHADTVTAAAAEGTKYGGWVVQVTATGTVSTLAETGQSGVVDMSYESAAAALTAAQAITLTADNVALGYIVVSQAEDGVFTANTTALTGVVTFTDGDEKTLPAKL